MMNNARPPSLADAYMGRNNFRSVVITPKRQQRFARLSKNYEQEENGKKKSTATRARTNFHIIPIVSDVLNWPADCRVCVREARECVRMMADDVLAFGYSCAGKDMYERGF